MVRLVRTLGFLVIGVAALALGHSTVEARAADADAAQREAAGAPILLRRGVTIRLIVPKLGRTVRGVVLLRAQARYPRGVARVVFAIDGRRIRIDRRSPFTGRWDTRTVRNGRHRLGVAAFTRHGRYAVKTFTVRVANPRDTTPPSQPTELSVADVTESGFQLSWAPSRDNVGVSGYEVLRNGSLVDAVAGTSSAVRGLPCGTGQSMAVRSRDAAGNRSAPATVTARTRSCGRVPPPPPSVFLSPTGSDSAPCAATSPCRSMDRAYRIANTASGPVGVQMSGGSYPGQIINPDPSKTTDHDVVFFPAQGAAVTVAGEIQAAGARHITIGDIAIQDDWYLRGSDDITIQDVDTVAAYINSSTRVRVLGGDYGPHRVAGATHVALMHIRGGTTGRTRDVIVEGAYFHDHTRAPNEHAEAMQIWSADDVTIANSRFKTCAVYCIFVANIDDPVPSRNVLIENNWFSPGADTAGSQGAISYWAYGLTIRNNSFSGRGAGPNDPAGYPSQNVLVTGNVGFQGPCNNYSWNTYSYNVWEGRTCSATDRNAPAGFVNAAAFDLHLRPDAAAINSGNPLQFPATDIDGESRPLGSRPDAGADERG